MGTLKSCKTREQKRLYSVWTSMRERCNSKSSNRYKYYGGRGIKVCEEWNSFQQFIEDMGERPVGYSIDRIDNNGNYCKENCRWASYEEQHQNKRKYSTEKLISFAGFTMTPMDWARFLGINNKRAFQQRIYGYKWGLVKAATTKLVKRSKNKKKETIKEALGVM